MIIDSHIHIGCLIGYYSYNLTLENFLDLMERINISYAINSNFVALSGGNYAGAVEDNLKAWHLSKGRILSYHVFNPNDSQVCMEIIRGYRDKKIFKGIKIHPSFHGVPADDGRYDEIWKYIAENDLVIFSHTWDRSPTNPVQELSFPSRFEAYIRKYPHATFICCHSGGRFEGIKEAARLGQKYGNVYFDTAGDIYSNYFIEYLVKEVGSERILFGSDYSMMDPRNMLGVVLGADISLVEKENILYRNASKLFGINIAQGGDGDD